MNIGVSWTSFSLPCHHTQSHHIHTHTHIPLPYSLLSIWYCHTVGMTTHSSALDSSFHVLRKHNLIDVYLMHLRLTVVFNSFIYIQTMSLPARRTCCTKHIKQIGHQRQKVKPLMIKGSITPLEDDQEGLERFVVLLDTLEECLSSDLCPVSRFKDFLILIRWFFSPKWKVYVRLL